MDFNTLKKNSGAKSIDQLNAELNKLNTNQTVDERYWTVEKDKAGNGYAIIRMLPPPANETAPWIRYWDHAFQGPGGWYIEKSLTTLGKDDPVSEHNSELWNSGIDSLKKIVSNNQKRRLSYVSNILVITDSAKPEREGKNYLFRYGAKIFDKFKEAMHPSFPGEEAMNPFDFWTGANFALKVREVEGYPNYDKSELLKPTALFDGDDEKLKALYDKLYSLQKEIDPSLFKSYDELKTKLCKVLGDTQPTKIHKVGSIEDRQEIAPKASKEKTSVRESENLSDMGLDDDTEEFFRKLREE